MRPENLAPILLVLTQLSCAFATQAPSAPPRSDAMLGAREGHTAVLLPDGKLLVAGGFSGPEALKSAELYDLGWVPAASMHARRASHIAALLPDGRVLVAGGTDGKRILASAEIYDPATDSWAKTGALKTARYSHASAVLADGRVLVAGGISDKGAAASAELFDPKTGRWSPAGSMKAARYGAAAARLPDGRVLVCGGSSPAWLSTAEVYDPAADRGAGGWSATESLRAARAFHTATVLPDGKVLVTGGQAGLHALASVEIYLPREGSWVGTDPMDTARAFHAATLLSGGKVLVAGGTAPEGPAVAVELYNPADGAWTKLGDLATPRYRHTASLLAGDLLLLAGGRDPKGVLGSIERITYAPPPARAPATAVSTAAVKAPAGVSPAGRATPSVRRAAGGRSLETVYWVQLGAFTETARAEALANALIADGNFVELFAFRNRGVLYRRVRVGPFATIGDARLERNQLAAQNVSGIVVGQRVLKNP